MISERKQQIKDIVLECFYKANIGYLPTPIEEIIHSVPHINIIPYSVFARDFNLTRNQVELYLGSADGCADYSEKRQGGIIYYNDLDQRKLTSNRYRWSLAHELGHILLKHHSDDRTRLYRSGLSDEDYDNYEEEADYFAQLILVPHACLCNFAITKPKHIELMCKISGQAARRRYMEYSQWFYQNPQMDSYDTSIFYWFYNYSFNRKCPTCNHVYIQQHGKYCIFCGNKLNWSSEKTMEYFKLPTYDNNKLKQCPICANEETQINGEFCQICGTHLVNLCTNANCRTILPTNARFCSLCGSQSSFYKDDILSTWEDENNNQNSWLDEIPDFDEELPFT